MKIVVGHLYPEYLNIYADRGNIAVLAARARWRGLELEVRAIGVGEPSAVDEVDLYYVGGGQDREQGLIAPDLALRGDQLRGAVDGGAALLAVCGGYQLLGRFYRDRAGRVLLECELDPGEARTLAGFENHAGRTILDEGAQSLGRVVAGFGNDGESGHEGCRVGRALGTYLHGPLLPRNPWLADWLLAQAVAHRAGGDPPRFEPLPDELEGQAHAVSAGRARSRGGRF